VPGNCLCNRILYHSDIGSQEHQRKDHDFLISWTKPVRFHYLRMQATRPTVQDLALCYWYCNSCLFQDPITQLSFVLCCNLPVTCLCCIRRRSARLTRCHVSSTAHPPQLTLYFSLRTCILCCLFFVHLCSNSSTLSAEYRHIYPDIR